MSCQGPCGCMGTVRFVSIQHTETKCRQPSECGITGGLREGQGEVTWGQVFLDGSSEEATDKY